MTIGERLEEARKRKGVSVREAAEATKIRGDYLLALEANKFEEVQLPDIYVRGFLKIYARFLKADPEKLVIDYDARMARRSSGGDPHSGSRESLGRMELPHDEEADNGEDAADNRKAPAQPAGRIHTPPPVSAPDELETERPPPAESDNALYIKIAVIGVSVGVVALLLVLLISLIRSPDTVPNDRPAATTEEPADATGRDVVLRATGDVTVIVEQVSDRRRLFQGSLNAGDAVSLEREGPVSIRFTDGEALVIERNGREVAIGAAGPGRTTIQ
ncbi:MAG: helix-turn-helix domain-containing protein [Opitutales bacterium]|nr:helix-turn-helix domain-containing protein [Opitutales bacterium]